jgi:hypothetical protein
MMMWTKRQCNESYVNDYLGGINTPLEKINHDAHYQQSIDWLGQLLLNTNDDADGGCNGMLQLIITEDVRSIYLLPLTKIKQSTKEAIAVIVMLMMDMMTNHLLGSSSSSSSSGGSSGSSGSNNPRDQSGSIDKELVDHLSKESNTGVGK